MKQIEHKIFIISGATGSGKSQAAIDIAHKLSGEIINADIGSFYKPLTIGTAKPDWQDEPVPHHLFDIIDEPVSFTITQFRDRVEQLCREIWQRGNIPVVVGGSVFYIQALFFKQHDIRDESNKYVKELEQSNANDQKLWKQLEEVDPERAKALHPHDRYRVIRALAIWKATGKKPSMFEPLFDPIAPFYFMICDWDRQILYDRINQRLKIMFEQGWLDEVRQLIGTQWEQFLMQKKMIGYDDLLQFLRSEQTQQSLQKAKNLIGKRTRNYAKRQITFLDKLEREINEHIKMNKVVGKVFKVNMDQYDLNKVVKGYIEDLAIAS